MEVRLDTCLFQVFPDTICCCRCTWHCIIHADHQLLHFWPNNHPDRYWFSLFEYFVFVWETTNSKGVPAFDERWMMGWKIMRSYQFRSINHSLWWVLGRNFRDYTLLHWVGPKINNKPFLEMHETNLNDLGTADNRLKSRLHRSNVVTPTCLFQIWSPKCFQWNRTVDDVHPPSFRYHVPTKYR